MPRAPIIPVPLGYVELVACDDFRFLIPHEYAYQSKLLAKSIAMHSDPDTGEVKKVRPCKLNARGETVAYVCRYMAYRAYKRRMGDWSEGLPEEFDLEPELQLQFLITLDELLIE